MQEKFNKETYKEYKSMAEESGIRFFSADVTGQGFPYNGVSIAYSVPQHMVNPRMIEVSVSYCAPEDIFKAKRGKFQALHKFFCTGETIKLPLGEFYSEAGGKATRDVLKSMFLV